MRICTYPYLSLTSKNVHTLSCAARSAVRPSIDPVRSLTVVRRPRALLFTLPGDEPTDSAVQSAYIVFVCVLLSGRLVCRPSDLCVCRVGTPPAR